MSKLIFYEYKKIFAKKSIFWFVILCLAVNIGLSVHKVFALNEEGISQIDLYHAYQKLDDTEMNLQSLENKMDSISSAFSTEKIDEKILKELLLISQIYNQVLELETYESYLDNMKIQIEKMSKSSLFSKENTYSERNLRATMDAYQKLHNVIVKADFDGGVLLVTENRATDLILIVVLAILVMEVFISERESGTWVLLKSMKAGHIELFISKMGTVFLSNLVVVILFYGSDFFIAALTLDFGNVNRAIQSVNGYFTSAMQSSVKQYLVYFFCMKIIGMISLCCIFIVLCVIFKSSIMASLAGIFTALIELLLWKNISVNSWLYCLRQMNLSAFVYTEKFFKEYQNMNFFSWPVSKLFCGIALAFFCIVPGCLISFVLYYKETVILHQRSNNYRFNIYRKPKEKKYCFQKENGFEIHASLWYYEFYKLFILSRGWIVFLLFIVLQGSRFIGIQYFISYEEFYYQIYSETLKGELKEEKESFLQEEKNRIETLERNRMEIIQKYENEPGKIQYYLSKLDIDSEQINAFERAYSQYQSLKKVELQDTKIEYVYETPWELLFGKKAIRQFVICYIMFVVVMLLILCSCGANEKITYMNELINISVAGLHSILIKKIVITIAIAGFVAIVALFPNTTKIISTYGLQGFKAPSRSYTDIPVFLQQYTLGEIFILCQVICFITACVISCLILFLSEKVGNRIYTLLMGTGIFLIPALTLLLL